MGVLYITSCLNKLRARTKQLRKKNESHVLRCFQQKHSLIKVRHEMLMLWSPSSPWKRMASEGVQLPADHSHDSQQGSQRLLCLLRQIKLLEKPSK